MRLTKGKNILVTLHKSPVLMSDKTTYRYTGTSLSHKTIIYPQISTTNLV